VPEPRAASPTLTVPGIEDLQPLGRGGFGTVYRGWQPELRRQVAVKVLDAPATQEESAARFRREVMAMGALSDHPNVVPVYATGTVGDRLYLVMPLLPDGSLADQLVSGPRPPAEVARLGRGLADALAAAHGAGVLHRDVKPANVLRTPYGSAQLADFGIARLADTTQTMGGSLLATVAYAAPEVLAGEAATERSDVYSLGATLHAALRGQPPFQSAPDETPIALALRVLSDPPAPLGPEVPPALVAVVERAMARDPADRFESAAAMRDALDDLDPTDLATAGLAAAAAGPDPLATAPLVVPPAELPHAAPVPAAADAELPYAAPTSADVDSLAATQAVATVAAPPDEAVPSAATPRDRDGRNLGLLAALALLVLLVGGAALWASRDGDGDAAAPTTTATTDPAASGPDLTSPEVTETSVPETTVATPAPVAPAGSAAEAVRRYYGVMDEGRIDEGFALLSPAYQERTGESSYRGFWESIASVEVLEAEGEDLQARATLRYTRDDGSTSTESVSIRFVTGEDGQLLIDDYQVG
jgi:hypothetical protein